MKTNNSRSKNAILNIIIGVIAQFGILLLSFIGRKIFINFLSADYLGINGLYSNILSVLALAELGLGNVTQFFLYKPVVEKDYNKICSLVKYFRKLYAIIAVVVLGIGLLLIPFLKYIINSNLQQNELIIYYIIFLLNSSVTYFAADKIALLAANQDNRLTKYITLSINFALQLLHIIVLMIWHNYIVYVLATLLCSVINVLVTNILCYRLYPYLKEKNIYKVEIDKKLITNNLKSTFVYKIGATIVNNTDNILISVMISTAAVGLYSNYYLVVSGIQAFLAVVTAALISGIGNLNASGNKKRMAEIFNCMLFIYHFIAAYGATGLFLLFNDLVPAWLGSEYLLDNWVVFAIAFSFYLNNAISPIWMFRESNGLFNKVKYLFLTTAIINIVLSIVLGKLLGVFGILIATPIAKMVTQVWYEPHILFKFLFDTSSKEYWFNQLKYVALSLISALMCFGITIILPHSFTFIFIKAVIYFVIFVIVFLILCRKSAEVNELKKLLYRITKKKKGV